MEKKISSVNIFVHKVETIKINFIKINFIKMLSRTERKTGRQKKSHIIDCSTTYYPEQLLQICLLLNYILFWHIILLRIAPSL